MAYSIKGDLDICRTGQARRMDEALVAEVLSANRQIVRHEAHWAALDGGALDRQIELPDATTLPEGWQEVVQNTGTTDDLNIREFNATSFTGTALQEINPSEACEFTLIDNSTAAGVWFVSCFDSPDTVIATKFCAEFLSGDFPAPVNDYRTLTKVEIAGFAAAVHGRGRTPIYLLQERSTAPVAATLIEQDLTFDADVPGAPGNNISVEYTTGATAGAEVVTVIGEDITVQIDSGVSTATQVKAAIDASVEAAALIDVTISGTAGDPQSAFGPTNLASGADGEWDRVTGDRERMIGGDMELRVVDSCEFDGRICFV